MAHAWYRQPQRMPAGVDPGGLEVSTGYKANPDTGTFSYAAHAVAVAVDPALGTVDLLDYVICEDGGTLINPLVVDGQILGGLAQGIGTALYEEMPYDGEGQPLASTLADYLLPGATEVPMARLDRTPGSARKAWARAVRSRRRRRSSTRSTTPWPRWAWRSPSARPRRGAFSRRCARLAR